MTRPFSATKSAFFKAYSRPIHPLYRRVVEELLVELHLETVNQTFAYDPFFALGVMTVFPTLLEGYPGEGQSEQIFTAICRALQLKPEVLQEDAQKLLALLSSEQDNGWKLVQRLPEAQDMGSLKGILERIADPKYHYSRILCLGFYTAYSKVAPAPTDEAFGQLMAQTYQFPLEQVKKDLSLYQNFQERMKQARIIAEDMVKAARRQKETRQNPV
ncbi:MAG: photosystem II biogenesis protein Psp29 [Synechococcales cyanobacterium]